MTEAIPLPATALLSSSLAIILGVAPAREVLRPYAEPIIFLFLGTFLLAEAFRKFALDRRVAALLLGLVNAVVRPVVVVLTFPITVLTLGLFLWVVNAAMLGIVAWLLSGFEIAGLGSALLASAIVSITSWVASWYIGPRGHYEVLIVRRDRALHE